MSDVREFRPLGHRGEGSPFWKFALAAAILTALLPILIPIAYIAAPKRKRRP